MSAKTNKDTEPTQNIDNLVQRLLAEAVDEIDDLLADGQCIRLRFVENNLRAVFLWAPEGQEEVSITEHDFCDGTTRKAWLHGKEEIEALKDMLPL